MKKRDDIDISEVLKNYLDAASPEQLIAELGTPSRVELMAIPDADFFFTAEKSQVIVAPSKDCDIVQTINLFGDLSFVGDTDLIWQLPPVSPLPINSVCSRANAANQELALAA